ncbi:nucleotidyltransferase domain-containing protein [Paenibacillus sp. Marseille-Q4541]|uniref:nucleotidyltransferase domain-containing protein n=1 Tax=Paenibacillus sp. Marseille-Q4541 TaxID=2831522 RepID=UPI0020199D37|nr:nucleotidyltransferase domain-containing protein [Paenibacillus sp. Marseille-Q4541]
MMLDVFNVSETLLNHIKMNYPDDIAIVAYYGSYAQGTASKRSDLDFFFIPATSKGYDASIQFLIHDISFDFWPISWERAESMASFNDSKTTIIADCKLLYVRSNEDGERFMKLRDTISSFQEPQHRLTLLEKSETELGSVYIHLYKLNKADDSENITFYRTEAHAVLTKVLQSLALINQTYFTKGFGKNKQQILKFPLKPAHLESYMHTIMHSEVKKDILQACEQLTEDTLELLIDQKEKYSRNPSYPDRLKGFYEEEKGTLDKIITACEQHDYETAFFSAIHAQETIASFLYFAETGHWPCNLTLNADYQDIYKRVGLPELVTHLTAHDLSLLQAEVQSLVSLLDSYLLTKGVEINQFQNIEQFEVFLKEKEGMFFN